MPLLPPQSLNSSFGKVSGDNQWQQGAIGIILSHEELSVLIG
jgi:hypothetical protein